MYKNKKKIITISAKTQVFKLLMNNRLFYDSEL